MGKYIHNNTGSTIVYQGRPIPDEEIFQIPDNLLTEYINDDEFMADVESGLIDISADGETLLTGINTKLAHITGVYQSSLAVDKDGTSQNISGSDWNVISSGRVLWDVGGNYDDLEYDFVVPFDGVYSFDAQIRITSLTEVSNVELALFQRGDPDDYWFILDKKPISGLSEIQLSGLTLFDMREGERYCLKIKLDGTLSSASISGNDDYTAWGFSFVRPLHY